LNYLLDTNTVSYLMEERAAVVERVRDAGGLARISISTITLAELRYGLRTMPDSRKKTSSLESLRRILDSEMDIRPFTASEVYSEAGARLKISGIAFSFEDLAIASIAISENKTLASNDGFFDHVRRLCGLRFERWEP